LIHIQVYKLALDFLVSLGPTFTWSRSIRREFAFDSLQYCPRLVASSRSGRSTRPCNLARLELGEALSVQKPAHLPQSEIHCRPSSMGSPSLRWVGSRLEHVESCATSSISSSPRGRAGSHVRSHALKLRGELALASRINASRRVGSSSMGSLSSWRTGSHSRPYALKCRSLAVSWLWPHMSKLAHLLRARQSLRKLLRWVGSCLAHRDSAPSSHAGACAAFCLAYQSFAPSSRARACVSFFSGLAPASNFEAPHRTFLARQSA